MSGLLRCEAVKVGTVPLGFFLRYVGSKFSAFTFIIGLGQSLPFLVGMGYLTQVDFLNFDLFVAKPLLSQTEVRDTCPL